jgi:hypothetical protein
MAGHNGGGIDGIKVTDILRSEIQRLRRANHKLQGLLAGAKAYSDMLTQVLATLLHSNHPDGAVLTEAQRRAAHDACLFRIEVGDAKDGDEGDAIARILPITDEERAAIGAKQNTQEDPNQEDQPE